jgi:transcription termination factor Rho
MASEQLPILFEDQNPEFQRKPVSTKNKMQSEDDWTPRASKAEEAPAAQKAALGETKGKPRVRKPRVSPEAPAEAVVKAPRKRPSRAGAKSKTVVARPAEETASASPTRPKSVSSESPKPALPAEAANPSTREVSRGAGRDRRRMPQESKEAKEPNAASVPPPSTPPRAEVRATEVSPRGIREGRDQREEASPRDTQGGSEARAERIERTDRGERSQGSQEGSESREREGRPRSEQQPRRQFEGGGGGNQERQPSRPTGGSVGMGGGGDLGDRQASFRGGKKKKGKKGRFERGGPERGAPERGGVDRGAVRPPQIQARPGDLPDPSLFQNLEELSRVATEEFTGEPLYIDSLHEVSLHDLVAQATAMGIVLDAAPNRRSLIAKMVMKAHEEKRAIMDRGALELTDRGYGFIVRHAYNYKTQPHDCYVAESFVRRFGLKKGHQIEAQVRPPEGPERCPSVVRLVTVMGEDPAKIADVVPFEDLVPYYPLERMLLEVSEQDNVKDVSMRAVDLLTPVGFGQRGLIVAPPRTGKTVLLQQVANSVARNNPNAKLIVLLVDERPEEVTDFRRNTRGEVVSSTFDEPASSHVEVAEMVIEKARRMVEAGEHVVILLDSITRLARAYNTTMPSSGKILSGGVEANALQKPKRFFGAARNIEGGGSLTILATALIDTGSRMDEVIFEEFKGTGNMELHLDRALIEKRIFPALNIERSGTRKEELLYHPDELNRVYSLRRAIQGVPMVEAMEMLVQRLKKTRSNAEFLLAMNR